MPVPANVHLAAIVSVNPDGSIRVPDGQTQVTKLGVGLYEALIAGEYPASELVWFICTDSPGMVAQPSARVTSLGVIEVSTYDPIGQPEDQPWSLQVFRVRAP